MVKEEWRFLITIPGVQCVMIGETTLMLVQFVNN